MPNTINSQYMGMPVPVPTVDPGPTYATDLNSCLTIVDQHDHSPGKGTQVTPAGININADLTFGSNNATALRSVRYTAQNAPLGTASDVGCLYVAGVDLYYNDVNGNQVRITSNGSIIGTSGSIGNLVSPASVTYNSGSATYVFQSDVNVPGTLDGGSVILRNISANSKGVTLSPPNALAGNYSVTFPAALPGATKIMSIDSAGNIGVSYDVDNTSLQIATSVISVKDSGITTAKIADSAVTNVKLAATACTFATVTGSTSSTSYVDFSAGGISITATNKFIEIGIVVNPSTEGYVEAYAPGTGGSAVGAIRIKRNDGVSWGFPIGFTLLTTGLGAVSFFPPGGFKVFDNSVVATTSYTYTVEAHTASGSYTISAVNLSMYVKELI